MSNTNPLEPGQQPRAAASSAADNAPRVARSASNTPLIADKDRPEENRPVRPIRNRKKPHARRMNLSLTRVSAWSVAKVSFMLSLAGAIIQIIAVLFLWLLLKAVGVFDQVTQIFSSAGLDSGSINLSNILSLPTVLSAVTIFSIVEMVLITIRARSSRCSTTWSARSSAVCTSRSATTDPLRSASAPPRRGFSFAAPWLLGCAWHDPHRATHGTQIIPVNEYGGKATGLHSALCLDI